MNLHKMAEDFCRKWGPKEDWKYLKFVEELRELVEAYGVAALQHESLPDTEHEHGGPV